MPRSVPSVPTWVRAAMCVSAPLPLLVLVVAAGLGRPVGNLAFWIAGSYAFVAIKLAFRIEP